MQPTHTRTHGQTNALHKYCQVAANKQQEADTKSFDPCFHLVLILIVVMRPPNCDSNQRYPHLYAVSKHQPVLRVRLALPAEVDPKYRWPKRIEHRCMHAMYTIILILRSWSACNWPACCQYNGARTKMEVAWLPTR